MLQRLEIDKENRKASILFLYAFYALDFDAYQ